MRSSFVILASAVLVSASVTPVLAATRHPVAVVTARQSVPAPSPTSSYDQYLDELRSQINPTGSLSERDLLVLQQRLEADQSNGS